ncbi:MAG: hypothetical protein OCC46_02820 [Pseudodesulfovibrio sp.]
MDIKSFDELLEYTSKVVTGEIEYEAISLEHADMIVPLKIDGEDWDKLMDVRHARHIIALQNTLDSLIDEYAPDIREEDRPLVRAEILEGSSDIQQYVKEFALALVDGMTDKQKFTIGVLAIAGAVGYFGFARHLDYVEAQVKAESAQKNQIQTLTQHEETKRQMLAPLLKIVDADPAKYAQYERPITKMTNMLEEGDQIALVGEGYISAEVAKAEIKPKRTRSGVSVSSCDGEYLLLKTDFSMGEFILHLEKDGIPLKAYTSVLDTEEKKELTDLIAKHTLEDEFPFPLDLQMSVEHTEKTIKYGSIVGIGELRADKTNKLLSELLTK